MSKRCMYRSWQKFSWSIVFGKGILGEGGSEGEREGGKYLKIDSFQPCIHIEIYGIDMNENVVLHFFGITSSIWYLVTFFM